MIGLPAIKHLSWRVPEWSDFPILQQTLLPPLSRLKEFALPVVKPYLEASEWRGQGNGGPLTVTYIGLPYGKWYLKNKMFGEQPVEIAKDPVSVRDLNRVIRDINDDIVIVACGDRLIRGLPRQHAVIVPLWVEQVLDIRGDWEDVVKRFRRTDSVDGEFRRLRKYQYSHHITNDERDLERYYHTMYLPTMESRHGENAIVVSLEESKKHFRHGYLVLVELDERPVAGCLCRAQGRTAKGITSGIDSGDEHLMRKNVMGALYLAFLQAANQEGFETFDFLGCPPYPRMGVFQFKRKWGATVGVARHLRKRVWFSFQHDSPAVRNFLRENPFISIDDRGNLDCLVLADSVSITQEDRAHYHSLYYSPGLKDLIVRPVTELLAGTMEKEAG